MYQPRTKAGTALLLLILVSLLTACNTPTAEQPTSTMDPNMIYTAAAQTVQAQFTQNAALTPSATATPLTVVSEEPSRTTCRLLSQPIWIATACRQLNVSLEAASAAIAQLLSIMTCTSTYVAESVFLLPLTSRYAQLPDASTQPPSNPSSNDR